MRTYNFREGQVFKLVGPVALFSPKTPTLFVIEMPEPPLDDDLESTHAEVIGIAVGVLCTTLLLILAGVLFIVMR